VLISVCFALLQNGRVNGETDCLAIALAALKLIPRNKLSFLNYQPVFYVRANRLNLMRALF